MSRIVDLLEVFRSRINDRPNHCVPLDPADEFFDGGLPVLTWFRCTHGRARVLCRQDDQSMGADLRAARQAGAPRLPLPALWPLAPCPLVLSGI